MAGIGFKLQQLFQEDYFSSRMKAYAFAGLVTAGPWIVVIATIAMIQWFSMVFLPVTLQERELFNLSISYSFIFSQVLFGIQQLVVTRYIADLFYEKKTNKVFPTFLGMTKVTLVLALTAWLIFIWISSLPFLYELLLLVLFVTINLIWVLFLFLSAAKFYQAVAYSFLSGAVIAVGMVFLLGRSAEAFTFIPHATSFMLVLGFTSGMIVTLFGLLFSMLITFPLHTSDSQFHYVSYFDKYPTLFWTGFLYNVGIWVCNWIIWFGEGRSILLDSFVYNRVYDTAIFWSYLTIIPTLIIFVVSVETRFYERYRSFYGYINQGGTLQQIKTSKESMQYVLKEELERLVRSQGLISIVIILSIGYVTTLVPIEDDIISIFRFTTVGAFSNAMVLVLTLILLYFEDRRGAMITSILFFSLNAVLTFLLLPFGFNGYGLSFALGSSGALLFALLRLAYFIEKVDYFAFCNPNNLERPNPPTLFTKLSQWMNKRTIL
ncbi:exopolysaccharide Pel transporter PelG [uncultured Marinococcus sp.]|uniref:exopolysaccharide Pel transporter PelG n=1 Tax=uncultured Marinococcus sp. TaxID=487012 RepID=UPI00262D3236|nr:exopolysaccharide Pel transporter PelG [uncultured Marinococcus sp.]